MAMPPRSRTRARATAAGGVALLLAAVAACGDDSDETEARARESWCGATCAAMARCGEGADARCEERCIEYPTGFVTRLTPDGLSAQAECLARAPECPDGFDALLSTCVEVWLALPPTPTSITTCEEMAAPLFECGWFNSFDQCASFYGVFTTPALEAWHTCSDILDCEAFAQCSDLTLYSYGD